MANNNLFLNAALSAFINGSLSGRKFTNADPASYIKIQDAAEAFSEKIDDLIPNDPTISNLDGTAKLAVTATDQASQIQLPALLGSICAAQLSGSYTEDSNPDDYTLFATACAAAFSQLRTALEIP